MFTSLRNAYARLTAALNRLAERFEEFEAQIGETKPEAPAITNGRKVVVKK